MKNILKAILSVFIFSVGMFVFSKQVSAVCSNGPNFNADCTVYGGRVGGCGGRVENNCKDPQVARCGCVWQGDAPPPPTQQPVQSSQPAASTCSAGSADGCVGVRDGGTATVGSSCFRCFDNDSNGSRCGRSEIACASSQPAAQSVQPQTQASQQAARAMGVPPPDGDLQKCDRIGRVGCAGCVGLCMPYTKNCIQWTEDVCGLTSAQQQAIAAGGVKNEGDVCAINSECKSNKCIVDLQNSTPQRPISRCVAAADFCSSDSQCGSGLCIDNKCAAPRNLGESCSKNQQCYSGVCEVNKCVSRVSEQVTQDGQCRAIGGVPLTCDIETGGNKYSQRLCAEDGNTAQNSKTCLTYRERVLSAIEMEKNADDWAIAVLDNINGSACDKDSVCRSGYCRAVGINPNDKKCVSKIEAEGIDRANAKVIDQSSDVTKAVLELANKFSIDSLKNRCTENGGIYLDRCRRCLSKEIASQISVNPSCEQLESQIRIEYGIPRENGDKCEIGKGLNQCVSGFCALGDRYPICAEKSEELLSLEPDGLCTGESCTCKFDKLDIQYNQRCAKMPTMYKIVGNVENLLCVPCQDNEKCEYEDKSDCDKSLPTNQGILIAVPGNICLAADKCQCGESVIKRGETCRLPEKSPCKYDSECAMGTYCSEPDGVSSGPQSEPPKFCLSPPMLKYKIAVEGEIGPCSQCVENESGCIYELESDCKAAASKLVENNKEEASKLVAINADTCNKEAGECTCRNDICNCDSSLLSGKVTRGVDCYNPNRTSIQEKCISPAVCQATQCSTITGPDKKLYVVNGNVSGRCQLAENASPGFCCLDRRDAPWIDGDRCIKTATKNECLCQSDSCVCYSGGRSGSITNGQECFNLSSRSISEEKKNALCADNYCKDGDCTLRFFANESRAYCDRGFLQEDYYLIEPGQVCPYGVSCYCRNVKISEGQKCANLPSDSQGKTITNVCDQYCGAGVECAQEGPRITCGPKQIAGKTYYFLLDIGQTCPTRDYVGTCICDGGKGSIVNNICYGSGTNASSLPKCSNGSMVEEYSCEGNISLLCSNPIAPNKSQYILNNCSENNQICGPDGRCVFSRNDGQTASLARVTSEDFCDTGSRYRYEPPSALNDNKARCLSLDSSDGVMTNIPDARSGTTSCRSICEDSDGCVCLGCSEKTAALDMSCGNDPPSLFEGFERWNLRNAAIRNALSKGEISFVDAVLVTAYQAGDLLSFGQVSATDQSIKDLNRCQGEIEQGKREGNCIKEAAGVGINGIFSAEGILSSVRIIRDVSKSVFKDVSNIANSIQERTIGKPPSVIDGAKNISVNDLTPDVIRDRVEKFREYLDSPEYENFAALNRGDANTLPTSSITSSESLTVSLNGRKLSVNEGYTVILNDAEMLPKPDPLTNRGGNIINIEALENGTTVAVYKNGGRGELELVEEFTVTKKASTASEIEVKTGFSRAPIDDAAKTAAPKLPNIKEKILEPKSNILPDDKKIVVDIRKGQIPPNEYDRFVTTLNEQGIPDTVVYKNYDNEVVTVSVPKESGISQQRLNTIVDRFSKGKPVYSGFGNEARETLFDFGVDIRNRMEDLYSQITGGPNYRNLESKDPLKNYLKYDAEKNNIIPNRNDIIKDQYGNVGFDNFNVGQTYVLPDGRQFTVLRDGKVKYKNNTTIDLSP